MKNIRGRINKIYDHYGPEIETKKFFEEMEELKSVIKNNDKENISQEMADVFITCMHMLSKFNISTDEVVKQIEYKIARQEERIHKEQLRKFNLTTQKKAKLNAYMKELIKREG